MIFFREREDILFCVNLPAAEKSHAPQINAGVSHRYGGTSCLPRLLWRGRSPSSWTSAACVLAGWGRGPKIRSHDEASKWTRFGELASSWKRQQKKGLDVTWVSDGFLAQQPCLFPYQTSLLLLLIFSIFSYYRKWMEQLRTWDCLSPVKHPWTSMIW